MSDPAWPVVSCEECTRALVRVGFRVTQRSEEHVLLERERPDESQVVLLPRVEALERTRLAAILNRAHMRLQAFVDLLQGRVVKICACGAQYEPKTWGALFRVGTMRDADGKKIELRNCAKCRSSMAVRLDTIRKSQACVDSSESSSSRSSSARACAGK